MDAIALRHRKNLSRQAGDRAKSRLREMYPEEYQTILARQPSRTLSDRKQRNKRALRVLAQTYPEAYRRLYAEEAAARGVLPRGYRDAAYRALAGGETRPAGAIKKMRREQHGQDPRTDLPEGPGAGDPPHQP